MNASFHAKARLVPKAALAWSVATVMAAAGVDGARAQSHVPDFNGVYGRDAHNMLKPYSAHPRGYNVVNGYNNEYLRPWVVELINRDSLTERSGQAVITAHSVCYPESVPYVFGGTTIQILQTPTEINMIFADPGQFRTIYLNRPHSENPKPSYWGESVGHFEGDTLVVDTIGIAVNPQTGSMGFFGAPHTRNLHLVERYRFLKDGEVSTAPPAQDESFDIDAIIPGANHLRLTFTVDDPIAYRKPWSVTLDYMPLNARVREYVCAENSRSKQLTPLLPTADVPDF
jgi:hypothetical protein